jgi:hypothetical protein
MPSARYTRRAVLAALVAAPALLLLNHRPASADGPIHIGALPGVAVDGHDVVAYFVAGRPTIGSSAITHVWRGVTWRFSSAANRDAFAADPQRYAPAYGGYCAWAAAQGYKASADPGSWRIVGGRLFLNYNAAVHRRWLRDVDGLTRAADANWPRIERQ